MNTSHDVAAAPPSDVTDDHGGRVARQVSAGRHNGAPDGIDPHDRRALPAVPQG
jgi:hypothetical protein